MHMARTPNAVERRKVATMEKAIFNPDVLFRLARYLNSKELRSVKSTCRKMGAKQTALGGLSLADETARRLVEGASGEEKACLPRHEGGRWIELYQLLLVRRSNLTFDLLVGTVHVGGDAGAVDNLSAVGIAVCRRNVMRAGRHCVRFSGIGSMDVGLIRPILWGDREWESLPRYLSPQSGNMILFDPMLRPYWGTLMRQKTEGWGDGKVHCVSVFGSRNRSMINWSDWDHPQDWEDFPNYESTGEMTLVLDYDKGTLGLLQNGTTHVLKDGLSGEYCWMARLGEGRRISIRRGN